LQTYSFHDIILGASIRLFVPKPSYRITHIKHFEKKQERKYIRKEDLYLLEVEKTQNYLEII